ncbi:cytochrome P450 [Actinomycetes bacterium KLBMP 9759]
MRSYPFRWPSPIDPPAWFVDLHEREPVGRVRLPSGDTAFLVSRHGDGLRVYTDPVFSRAAAHVPGAPRYAEAVVSDGSLLSFDPPEHTRLRRAVSGVFTARRIAALRTGIERVVDRLLDDAVAGGRSTDLVAALCEPLPIQLICQVLGVPHQDRVRFDAWAQVVLAARAATGDERLAASRELKAYLGELLAAKRTHPADDVLTDLAVGDLTEREAVTFAQLLLVAGYGTTLNQLAITFFVLLRSPELFAAVHRDRATIPIAVEEIMRLHACANGTFVRVATADVEIAGVLVPAGSGVVVNAAAANRDPAVHPRPNELDLGRPATNHFTFGQGPHYCLGAPLARAEMQIALGRVLERLPTLRLTVEPADVPWRQGQVAWGPESLPVAW